MKTFCHGNIKSIQSGQSEIKKLSKTSCASSQILSDIHSLYLKLAAAWSARKLTLEVISILELLSVCLLQLNYYYFCLHYFLIN